MIAHRKKATLAQLTDSIIKGIREKKGIDIIQIDLKRIKNAICDRFIVCSGSNRTQVEAIADSIRRFVKTELGVSAWHAEGYENAEWILIDYFDIVVHVFLPQSRDYYKLEDLWADAEIKYMKADV